MQEFRSDLTGAVRPMGSRWQAIVLERQRGQYVAIGMCSGAHGVEGAVARSDGGPWHPTPEEAWACAESAIAWARVHGG